MTGKITTWVMVFGVLVWGVWDIYVAANDVEGDTISEKVRKWSAKSPLLPFLLGLLIGHWYA